MVTIGQFMRHLLSEFSAIDYLTVRQCISLILIPTILLCMIPNLKYLAPFSALANIFNFIAIFAVFYYCLEDVSSLEIRPAHVTFSGICDFFGVALFAMQCMGILIPIENQTEDPSKFFGFCGILNIGMISMITTYLTMGVLGALKYGDEIHESIVLNLPIHHDFAKVANVLMVLAVFLPLGLHFFVIFEAFWNMIEDRVEEHRGIMKFCTRLILILMIYLMAVTIPTIGAFVGLMGAVGYSIIDLICPPIIQTMILYRETSRYGKYHWKLWKNVVLLLFGIFIFIFGTINSLTVIYETVYMKHSEQIYHHHHQVDHPKFVNLDISLE